MLSCFGHFSQKRSTDAEGLQHGESNASSQMSSQESTGRLNRIKCFLKQDSKLKTGSRAGSPTIRTSNDMKDYALSRWTNSSRSSGSSDARSIGLLHGTFYNLERQESPRNFITSAQLAHEIRQQSEREDSLDAWGSMSSSLQPAPSWGMNSWEVDADDVQICLDSRNRPWQLGSGGFGRVFRAEMGGSTPVAVKFVNRQNPRELRRFVHEIGILRNLRHINIVQFLGAYLEGGQMILVTEYMVGGDLFDVIGHDMQQTFSWYRRGQNVALDVVRGLLHMHSRRIIHLDLKSANILLARDGTAKIADVGLAKVLSRESTQASMQSTFDWAAPEVLAGQACSDKADIWSLGVVLWEIASGEAPKLRQLRPLNCPEECPEEVRDIIVACRASKAEDRPDAREVFKRLSAAVNSPSPLQSAWSMRSNGTIGTFDSLSRMGSLRPNDRPPWASPEHLGDEEGPSFMAAIYEDSNPLTSARSMGLGNLQSLMTPNTLRKCAVDLPPRAFPGSRMRDARRSCEQLRSQERSTSL